MRLRVITGSELRRLVPMSECIDIIRETMKDVSNGNAVLPLRWGMGLPNQQGMMGIMPGYIASPECFGLKLVSLFPGNTATEFPSHMGLMVLFEANNGAPIALLDSNEITKLRTAAASAVATDMLARKNAGILTILGNGEQAGAHLEAILEIRNLQEIYVWGRNSEKVKRFARQHSDRLGVSIQTLESAEDAVRRADIICATTSAKEPVLSGDWLQDGAHVNLVGSSIPSAFEADTSAVVRSKFYVDWKQSTLHQAAEFLRAMEEGAVDESHIAGEIGEVLNNNKTGRLNDEEITLYKSLGIVAQDLATAYAAFEIAEQQDIGVTIIV